MQLSVYVNAGATTSSGLQPQSLLFSAVVAITGAVSSSVHVYVTVTGSEGVVWHGSVTVAVQTRTLLQPSDWES